MGNDQSMLLLENGDPNRDGQSLSSTQAAADSGDIDSDSDSDDSDFTDDAEQSSPSEDSAEEDGDEEINPEDDVNMEDDVRGEGSDEEEQEQEQGEEEELNQAAHDLVMENADLEHLNPRTQVTASTDADKMSALRAAFPTAPEDICKKVLAASRGNVKTAYNALCDGFDAQLSRQAVLSWNPKTRNRDADVEQSRKRKRATPGSTDGIANEPSTSKSKLREPSPEADSANEEDEHRTRLVRKFGLLTP